MATGQLGLNCATIIGNTGLISCPYDPKNFNGILLLPKGTALTPAQVSAFQTTVNAGIINDNASARWFPIGIFEDIEDKGTDAVETETGYGVAKLVRLGKYRYRFMYSNGAMDLHAELSKFNGRQDAFDLWFTDPVNNGFLGTASGQSNVKGFSLDTLYAPNIKVNTGAAASQYMFEVGLEDEKQFNQNWRFIKLPDTLPVHDTFTGLKPTRLEIVSELVASTKVVVVRVWSGNTNLYDTYSVQLATTNLWDAINNATGVQNATASVVAAPATKAFTVTLTSTVTAAEEYTIQLGTVTQLTAAAILKQANAETNTTAV